MAWQLYNCLFCMRGLKNIRLQDYNYHNNGWYFVTIISDYRRLFSPTERRIISQEIRKIPLNEPGVAVDSFVVMDNHVHMVLLFQGTERPLGEVIRRLKARATRLAGKSLWKPNYYEHVIRSEDDLEAVREYILLNPVVRKQRNTGYR